MPDGWPHEASSRYGPLEILEDNMQWMPSSKVWLDLYQEVMDEMARDFRARLAEIEYADEPGDDDA